MKKLFISFSAIAVFLIVSACQTTQLTDQKAKNYQLLISEVCVTRYMQDASQIGGDQAIDKISIYRIDHGPKGWERVSFAASGLRSNFYLNHHTSEIFCNSIDWRDKYPDIAFTK